MAEITEAPDECKSSFLGYTSNCSEAKGERNDGISWPTFPESTSVASRCVTNLVPILQAEAPAQVNRRFS